MTENDREAEAWTVFDVIRDRVPEEIGDAEAVGVEIREKFRNDLFEYDMDDGRTLIVKRAGYSGARTRFESSGFASDLIREDTGLTAPRYLDLPIMLEDAPTLAYWRIPLPTLRRVWPGLPEPARADALRSWGGLIREVHSIELDGHGGLVRRPGDAPSASEFLAEDVDVRLGPMMARSWPPGVDLVERLFDLIDPVVAAYDERDGAVLVHNDLWMGNVLCKVDHDVVECVGVIDLEDALAGPPEADLAQIQVFHSPFLWFPLDPPWFDEVLEGYGERPDGRLLAFFRVYQLVSIGVFMADGGRKGLADRIADAARDELDALEEVGGAVEVGGWTAAA